MDPTRTMTGRERRPPKKGDTHKHEIEPGRPVPNDWDKHMYERWEDRKGRLAAARASALS